jgi:hypothetical protein
MRPAMPPRTEPADELKHRLQREPDGHTPPASKCGLGWPVDKPPPARTWQQFTALEAQHESLSTLVRAYEADTLPFTGYPYLVEAIYALRV